MSLDSLSRSKLGRAAISARASSILLMTGASLGALSILVISIPGGTPRPCDVVPADGGCVCSSSSSASVIWFLSAAAALSFCFEDLDELDFDLLDRRVSPCTERKRRFSESFRLCLPSLFPPAGAFFLSIVVWASGPPKPPKLKDSLLGAGAFPSAMVMAIWPSASSSSSELCPPNLSAKSTWLPAAAINPNMLWFIFINMPPA